MNTRRAVRAACVPTLTLVIALSPFSLASAATIVPIGDPVTDTIQLWTGILASIEAATHDVVAMLGRDIVATGQTNSHSPNQLPSALTASAVEPAEPTV